MQSVIIAAVFAVLRSFSDQMGYREGFWYTFTDKSDRSELNFKFSTRRFKENYEEFSEHKKHDRNENDIQHSWALVDSGESQTIVLQIKINPIPNNGNSYDRHRKHDWILEWFNLPTVSLIFCLQ